MGILVHNNQCIILRIRLNSQCINRERSYAIRLIFFSRGLCRALVVCWQKRHKESWSFLMDKLLLHSCCAPCSVYCVDTLRADGIEPTSLWFNPNIHPWTEYDARPPHAARIRGKRACRSAYFRGLRPARLCPRRECGYRPPLRALLHHPPRHGGQIRRRTTATTRSHRPCSSLRIRTTSS